MTYNVFGGTLNLTQPSTKSVLYAWTGKLAQCCCVETRDNERDECEQRLRELEELIGREESQLETKQAVRGELLI